MVISSIIARRLAVISIAGALTFAVSCGQSTPASPTSPSTPTSPQGPGIDFTININGNNGSSSYSPSPLNMRVGQVVNWHNLDSIEHTATLSGVFDTGAIAAFSAHDNAVKMNTAGTFTYHCSIHPGMVGTIVVQ